MKLPQTSLDLVVEIYQSIDKGNRAEGQRYKQLSTIISRVDGDLVFEAVNEVFSDTSRGYRRFEDQEFAGKLLANINPKLTKDYNLRELLERVLPNYNLSIEEYPIFLERTFGLEKLISELSFLKNNSEDEELLESINAFNFWLKIFKEE